MSMLQKIVDAGVKLTPMMEQYYQIKKEYADTMLLFRMGDFYEVFFEDAQDAAKILNITQTHRGKLGDFPIPMAGIPHHAASAYIDRITSRGLKVAICEQVQDPKDAIGIVKRAVTQVVSPGIPYDLEKAEGHDHRYLTSAFQEDDKTYLIALDFTTGEFTGHCFQNIDDFLEKLRLLAPREFMTFMGQWEDMPKLDLLLNQMGTLKTHLSQEYFDKKYTELYIEKVIPTFKRDEVIKLNLAALNPIGALSYYICSTQALEQLFHIKPFRMLSDEGSMRVTLPTLTGLEILPKSRELYKDSLLGFMNKTQTAMGARRLKHIFCHPLTNYEEITQRQELVQYFMNKTDLLEQTREELSHIRDLERILAKVSTNKATASDLLATSRSIAIYTTLKKTLKGLPTGIIQKLTRKESESLLALAEEIDITINDEVGAALEKGNLIKEGAHKKRDRMAKLSRNADAELLKLETRYREETGIPKLKVKRNNIAGYFIEVSKVHTDKVPKTFDRRQTLVNSERYMTEELAQFEKEMTTAKDKLERLEREIFKGIITHVAELAPMIMKLSHIISHLDVFQSFAWTALQEDFTCPKIKPEEKVLRLKGAWHPLIKSIIKDQFVCHDIDLNKETYFGLITGPNMAGKTTVMREVAIVQLLTQIGSYVPASLAEVGLCDYLFSRLGASDDILKGQSTFMVEMAETAEILRHASEKSLIILDEVGRGTSTYDGLSIAWSLVEHFVEKTQAITLFATHYHELIDLVEGLKPAKNLTVETMNQGDDVHFLYRLVERGASQSFGIYVAKLAGIPQDVLYRSQEILGKLESSAAKNETEKALSGEQLSFFDESVVQEVPPHLKQLEGELASLDVMQMTPIQAMQKLQDLKDRLPMQ